MAGFRFGQFVFPKKLGKSIHDSKRNAKKREKLHKNKLKFILLNQNIFHKFIIFKFCKLSFGTFYWIC